MDTGREVNAIRIGGTEYPLPVHAGDGDVPGDQQAALRKRVRSAVRKCTGHPVQTLARGSMLVFVCEPIHQQHAAERERRIARSFGGALTGQPAQPMPTPWRLSWDTCEAR